MDGQEIVAWAQALSRHSDSTQHYTRTYLTPALQARGAGGGAGIPHTIGVTLSDRQRDVLGLLRQGFTYARIAGHLRISTKTVEYHIDMLKRRVGVSGRAQLIRWSEQFFREDD